MYDSRIRFAINHFIESDYFKEMSDTYTLEENSSSGKSILHLSVQGQNICVEDFDNKKKCEFVAARDFEGHNIGMKKSVDHFILKKNSEGIWNLHMIEMKTSVGNSTWMDIKKKVRASYLNIKALCVFLGIEISGVYTITTYEEEKFEGISEAADIRSHMPLLGVKAKTFKDDEWDMNVININIDGDVLIPHRHYKMTRNADGYLEGNTAI